MVIEQKNNIPDIPVKKSFETMVEEMEKDLTTKIGWNEFMGKYVKVANVIFLSEKQETKSKEDIEFSSTSI